MSRGFTLLEILLTLAILAIVMSIAIPNGLAFYQQISLVSTAYEIESALTLARQMSMDESREFAVILGSEGFSIREHSTFGRIRWSKPYPNGIMRYPLSDTSIAFNRNGVSGYGKFVLANSRGQRMDIIVHIGTGRIETLPPY